MKTYYILPKRFSLFLFAGMITLSFISCGTYQNSSYDDRDGIYSNSNRTASNQGNGTNGTEYKQYFESMQEVEVLTDVDNYSSNNYDQNSTEYQENYGAWGSNSDNVTVNIYQDSWGYNNWYAPYWGYSSWYGPSWGFGWNNYYGWNGYYGYGGYYGWNNPYYGGYYGWNNPYYGGWYNPYYGNNYYGNNYAPGIGRRNNTYSDSRNNYSTRGTTRGTDGSVRNYSSPTRTSTGIRNYDFNSNRTNPTRINNTRSTTPVRGTINRTPTRNATPSRNVTPTRNMTPSTPAPTRTYTPSAPTRSSGSSSGSSSGGRSSGGGRR